MKKKKFRKRFIIIIASIWAVIVALNLLAWNVPSFSDWYIDHFTMLWVNTYSRLTGLFSFSVGEVMLIAGAGLVIGTVLLTIVMLFFVKRKNIRTFLRRWYKTIISIATAVCLIMTLNCTILYHAAPLDANGEAPARQYTLEELEILRNYIVEKCNEYSVKFTRDGDGYIIEDGSKVGSLEEIKQQAKAAMNNISGDFPRLAGFYPDAKGIANSVLLTQMNIAGYYFPFSLEANYNTYMYILDYPQTICHELSHLHGYIFEDEANFLSFKACVESGDEFFEYSGYMSVMAYVYNAYAAYVTDWDEYAKLPQLSELAAGDNIFLTEEKWTEVEQKKLFDTEKVGQASENFTDSVLKSSGVEDGIISYSRVVGLLLQYYDGVLY